MLSFTDVKLEDTTLWTATSYANTSGNGAKMVQKMQVGCAINLSKKQLATYMIHNTIEHLIIIILPSTKVIN